MGNYDENADMAAKVDEAQEPEATEVEATEATDEATDGASA